MEKLETPKEFAFPFTPYHIQIDFMKKLYEVIEEKKIGIFESPTGTGKSMSIICGTLAWIADDNKRILEFEAKKTLSSRSNENTEFDWLNEFSENQRQKLEETDVKKMQKQLIIRNKKLKKIRTKLTKLDLSGPMNKKRKYLNDNEDASLKELINYSKKLLETNSDEIDAVDDEFLVDEYLSDDESEKKYKFSTSKSDEEEIKVQKVFYCSRTHSQLTQFIREIQKSPYMNVIEQENSDHNIYTTVVALASRQSLCINDNIRRLGSLQLMNEACLDMQKNTKKCCDDGSSKKPKNKKSSGCPYKNQAKVERLSDEILSRVQDIEEIVKKGRKMEACPYYAERHAIALAQIVVVPYQILLHNQTREATGIDLTDAVIIVDEAHNLVDTITNIHSVMVTLGQVHKAENQLTQYMRRYSKRLKAKNLHYIRQILFVLKGLTFGMGLTEQDINQKNADTNESTTILNLNKFLFKCKIEHINLFKVLQYCEKSMISQKLNGFVENYSENSGIVSKENTKNPEIIKEQDNGSTTTQMRSPLHHIENFFRCLTSADSNGRITLNLCKSQTKSDVMQKSYVKFNLLNPAVHFTEIITKCRALVVAGGTMKPTSCFIDQLLLPTGVEKSRIIEFSCGHVINDDQLLPAVLEAGPGGIPLDFTFQNRNNIQMIHELGRLIANMCNVIPGGVVCFFPSYAYESLVYDEWKKANLLERIEQKKKIFREPKKTSEVDKLLAEYSKCIEKCKMNSAGKLTGSLILSVVGGKMSEGINFSDDLGRCVIMVGMPYPNLTSPELKEKMNYLDSTLPKDRTGRTPGAVYYENLCMKAVNQSIGRAIRHKDDFATIILADKRYARLNTVNHLPGWIQDKLHKYETFGPCFAAIRKFFIMKKEDNMDKNC